MRTYLKHLFYLIVFSLSTSNLFGQDPVYSQYYNAPLELNPAFAGNSFAPIFALNYRNQWPGVSSVYETYSVSYDQYIDKYKSGIGLNLFTDDAGNGAIKTFKVSGIYAYKLKIKEDLFLKIGLEASAIQTRLNWDLFSFPDQIDPEFGATSPGGVPFPTMEMRPDNLSKTFFDMSTGVLLYNPLFYAGIALKHITSPDDTYLNGGSTFSGLPFRMSFHGGFQINMDGRSNKKDEGSFITPNVLFVKQADFTQLNIGAYTNLNRFFVGLWYRHASTNPDALIASVGMRSGVFKFSYSYDYTISELTLNTGGSHEIGILINLESVYPQPSKLNDCLRLFK